MQSRNKEQNQTPKQSLQPPRIDALELKLSPHFFFNVLNSVYHSIRLNPDQAEDIVINLSELLQYHVYTSISNKVPLEREIRSIRNFVYLQKMKFPPEFNVDVTVKGETQNQLIAPFVFMTLIENVFKNGLSSATPNSFLKADFSILNNNILLVTTHNIPQSDQTEEYEKSLTALQSRLQTLYPTSYYLKFEKTDKVCTNLLQIPLN